MDSEKHDNKCIHEMYIGTCAICLGLQTPEEEQKEIDGGIVKLSERLNAL